ncbi:hypothetical protein ABB28_03160 [Stenotrophomonas chelatiphaga]|uniref:KAP NTPase domain-containing protein n=1 Tax=Stenotrophomonas chelatiphaga TaxID=517011 RepID=A0A0R0D4G0_9GAMM|nr:P-loop NTPase fold protein [Stenotrophomonas chelatiphaga]KRG76453.1 hypothetical protein ABB28_03160 [Stenotrophomonas chelatiphaga]
MKDRIHSYLADYINGEVDPGTAVLITGPWGCGKTRFIQDYFGVDSKANATDERSRSSKDPKALFASFFGSQTEMDLLSQFAAQLHPKLTSRPAQAVGAMLMTALRFADDKFAGGAVLGDSDGSGLLKWLASPDGHVLVFDDLERSSMSLIERLATINRYVDVMGLKVIVIANEDELGEDDYLRWKEKVIGKTLRVDADPGSVLKELANQLTDAALKRCVLDNLDSLSGVLKQLDTINYRSVRSLIFDVQRLVSAAPALRGSDEAMLSILNFSLAVGSLLRADLIDESQVDLAAITNKTTVQSGKATSEFLAEMHRRFRAVGAVQPIVSPTMMARLWCDGEIDERYLDQVTSTHRWIVGDAAQPAWLWLREPGQLTVTRYQEQKKRLLQEIDSGKVLEAGVLLHVIDIHLQLTAMDDGVLPKGTNVGLWVSHYLDHHDVGGPELGQEEFSAHQHGGYRYRSADDEFKEAAEQIRDHLGNRQANSLRGKAVEWVEDIRNGDLGTLAFEEENLPGRRAWLHLVDAGAFARILLIDGTVTRSVADALESRYAGDGEGKLEPEWTWLGQLKVAIDAEAALLPYPHRQIVSEYCSKTFAYIETQVEYGKHYLRRFREFEAKLLGVGEA